MPTLDPASTGDSHRVDHVGVDGGLPARPTRPRTPGQLGRTPHHPHPSARQPEVHPAGPGFHVRQARGVPVRMEVLGDLPLRVAYERLAGMVRMLGEDVQAVALRNAYAIDMPALDTLTRRRERIAGIHGLSIDTNELYERNMIDELALRLVHGQLPVGSWQAGRLEEPSVYPVLCRD